MKKILSILLVFTILAIGLSIPASSALEFEIDGNGVLTKYNGTGGDVVIPDTVIEIGEGAFEYCYSLKSVTIPDSVVTIGPDAFHLCNSLESIIIPDSVITLGHDAFGECASLKSVIIPDSVITIGYNAFNWCTSLKSIIIPDSVTTLDQGAFFGCTSLRGITISDSITEIGDATFASCSSLKSITIPDSVTDIGSGAFDGCKSLKSVTIPYSVTRIGSGAFSGCESLYNIILSDSVEVIEEQAFFGCPSLLRVIIPHSVTIIGEKAFGYDRDRSNMTKYCTYNITISGYLETAAQVYANTNDFRFLLLDEVDDVVLRLDSSYALINSEGIIQTNKSVSGVNPKVRFSKTTGKTMIPFRFVSETLGATVLWSDHTYTATIILNDTVVKVTIDSDKMIKTTDGKSEIISLEEPARLYNGSTYIPLRDVAEALGCKVAWRESGSGSSYDGYAIVTKNTSADDAYFDELYNVAQNNTGLKK